MTIVVPYDGSPLGETGLHRAGGLGRILRTDVVAVVIVPQQNARYARECGWLAPDEPFHRETIAERLRQRVSELAPRARFRYELIDRYAPVGSIGTRLRSFARGEDASLVVIGSDNAGGITRSLASVGRGADAYDVRIVRRAAASPVPAITRSTPDFDTVEPGRGPSLGSN